MTSKIKIKSGLEWGVAPEGKTIQMVSLQLEKAAHNLAPRRQRPIKLLLIFREPISD